MLQCGRGLEPRRTRFRAPCGAPGGARFNAAAVLNRGEPRTRGRTAHPAGGFNAAAVLNRGELDGGASPAARRSASNPAAVLNRGELGGNGLLGRVAELQCGRGLEPRRTSSPLRPPYPLAGFNAAAVLNRGELEPVTAARRHRHRLQCGRGLEPRRTVNRPHSPCMPDLASMRPRS